MKPPKRSPFLHSRQRELLEVYCHLYPASPFLQFDALPVDFLPEPDRHKALSIVQLWINRSACPFAVETTALLVQSIILDETMQRIAASTQAGSAAPSLQYALEQMGGGAELGVRLNYSLALTRFVNSVVDSHQTGGFAQSIAAIAARIGLPLWFVEIRHAVTHEELPSIAVCRQAAGAALAWLHRHFWIPQLFEGPYAIHARPAPNSTAMDIDTPHHPTAAEASTSAALASSSTKPTATEEESRRKERRKALTDLRVTLKTYRSLAKQVARDRSLANTSKDQFRRLYKQLAVFVAKIRTLEPEFAAQLIDGAGSAKPRAQGDEADARNATLMDPDDVDECTKSALSDLINQLLQPGGLIPLSRSKRVPASAAGDAIALPAEVASTWSPLLGYLRDTYGPIFGQLLSEELFEAMLGPSEGDEPSTVQDPASNTTADADDDAGDPSSQHWKLEAFASPSYRKTAEAWMRYLVTSVPPSTPMPNSIAAAGGNRAPAALITDIEVAELCLPVRSPGSTSLLEFLCARNDELQQRIGPLVAVLQVQSLVQASEADLPTLPGDAQASGFEGSLEVMQRRLDEMNALPSLSVTAAPEKQQDEAEESERPIEVDSAENVAGVERSSTASKMPVGWSMAPSDWKPTPLGCLRGTIPDLVLKLH